MKEAAFRKLAGNARKAPLNSNKESFSSDIFVLCKAMQALADALESDEKVSRQKIEQVSRLEPQWRRLEPYMSSFTAAAAPVTLSLLQGGSSPVVSWTNFVCSILTMHLWGFGQVTKCLRRS